MESEEVKTKSSSIVTWRSCSTVTWRSSSTVVTARCSTVTEARCSTVTEARCSTVVLSNASFVSCTHEKVEDCGSIRSLQGIKSATLESIASTVQLSMNKHGMLRSSTVAEFRSCSTVVLSNASFVSCTHEKVEDCGIIRSLQGIKSATLESIASTVQLSMNKHGMLRSSKD